MEEGKGDGGKGDGGKGDGVEVLNSPFIALPLFCCFHLSLFLRALQMIFICMHMSVLTSAKHFQGNSTKLLQMLPSYDDIIGISIETIIV